MVAPDAPDGAARRSGAAAIVLLMFFLSGAAALVYQIVWAKQLALVFGVTIYANSAVITAFMAGLALGSLYIGRLADRWDRPLLFFALLEAGIGVFGACFPLLANAATPLYVAFYGPFGSNHYVMSLVRFALSFLMLFPPTALMGGTLPVLSRAYVRHQKRLGGEVAGLYSINNFGAFIGCVLAGYVFLEFLGQTSTLHLAAGLNLFVAIVAVALDKRLGVAGGVTEPVEEEPADEGDRVLPPAVVMALWVFGIEGFTSLAYQMAWTRLLIFFVATNTYALTTIVATFLVGLSLGAFLVRWFVDRTDPYKILGVIEVGIGISALITIPLLPRLMAYYMAFEYALGLHNWVGSAAARFAISMVVILIPTTLMGATMPVVSRIYVPALKRLGRRMGVIGCLDTLGSIGGAFAGGFIMIPVLGIQRTIIATALINLALGAWVFAARPAPRRGALRRPAFLGSALLVLAAPALLLMPRVPFIYDAAVAHGTDQVRLVDYEEDVESSVTVLEYYNFYRELFVNEAAVGSTARDDRPSHDMLAHLPLLLHPDPHQILLIGYGMGLTSRAATAHGVDVDVVELSPGVRRVSHCFNEDNGDVLSDPRVHLYIDDGRNYVLGTEKRYDVVQAGIIHPGVNSGNAGFYSVDFYRECKRILAPGGIVCQWLPVHNLPLADVKMLIRSFQAEFPHTSIWLKYTGDFCILIGTQDALHVDFAQLERRVNQDPIKAALAQVDVVNVYDFLSAFCAADDVVRDAMGTGPLNTDDRLSVEFHCTRSASPSTQAEAICLLGAMRQSVWPCLYDVPPDRADEVKAQMDRWTRDTDAMTKALAEGAVMAYSPPGSREFQTAYTRALGLFDLALHLNPDDATARFLRRRYNSLRLAALGRWLYSQGYVSQAHRVLEPLAATDPQTEAEARGRYLDNLIQESAAAPASGVPPAAGNWPS